MGYAHGLSTGTPLASADFTGGEQAVASPLEALGFSVLRVPNPDWTRDEIVLAGELVADNGWRQLESGDQRVKDLSELLQSPVIHPGRRHPDFRNPHPLHDE
jgi:5-methylcytosine-specific restriction protein A